MSLLYLSLSLPLSHLSLVCRRPDPEITLQRECTRSCTQRRSESLVVSCVCVVSWLILHFLLVVWWYPPPPLNPHFVFLCASWMCVSLKSRRHLSWVVWSAARTGARKRKRMPIYIAMRCHERARHTPPSNNTRRCSWVVDCEGYCLLCVKKKKT